MAVKKAQAASPKKAAKQPRKKADRTAVPHDVKQSILHEAGYRCSVPTCRTMITLDVHHVLEVEERGQNTADNLLAVCPNCHALYHRTDSIPRTSVRAWKMLLLALNQAYDRRSVDVLLALDKMESPYVSGDSLLTCAALIAGRLVAAHQQVTSMYQPISTYRLFLTDRGRSFINAWKDGDQEAAIRGLVNPGASGDG